MRLPRGVSANRLIRALALLGYQIVRQDGSHIRMRRVGPPAHSVTIPNHDALKTGTLHSIIATVSKATGRPTKSLTALL